MTRKNIRQIIRHLHSSLRTWMKQMFGDVSWQFVLAEIYRPWLHRVIFIGVTGSTGKTTTSDLTAAVLSSFYNGIKNWGGTNQVHQMPKTIFHTRPWHKFCVQEMGASQGLRLPLRLIQPRIGVVTAIGTDHISTFRTMEAIASEKGKLIEALPQNGTAILNADDGNVLAMKAKCTGRVITYGVTLEAMVRAENVRCCWPERLSFTVHYGDQSQFVQTQMCATHLTSSVLAALAVGVAMGVPLAIGAQAVARVRPYPGRMCPVPLPGGVTIIRDDIKASLWTIPSALKFIQEAEARRKIIVMGTISDLPRTSRGKARRQYAEIAMQALDVADYVFFVGPWASKALEVKQDLADDQLRVFSHVESATQFLKSFLQPEDLVLIKGSSKTDNLHEIVLQLRDRDIEKNVAAQTQFSANQNLDQFPLVTPSCRHERTQANNDSSIEATSQFVHFNDQERIQVVVGLGNPATKNAFTPHNVGHRAIDSLFKLLGREWTKEDKVMFTLVNWKGNAFYLVKPMIGVNHTGSVLSGLRDRMRTTTEDFILVFDDLNLPIGSIRTRMKGSSGGHKGVDSIIEVFQTEKIRRVKIGVGQPNEDISVAEYVLTPFPSSAQEMIDRACTEAANRILELVKLS